LRRRRVGIFGQSFSRSMAIGNPRKSGPSNGLLPFDQAVRRLTVRALGYNQMPDEDWVTITARANGGSRVLTIPWRVYSIEDYQQRFQSGSKVPSGGTPLRGLDFSTALINEELNRIFAQARPLRERPLYLLDASEVQKFNPLPSNLTFNAFQTGTKSYGYIRIYSFDYPDPVQFYNFFCSIVAILPERLIIDVRANPGVTIPSGESVLSLFKTTGIQFAGRVSCNTSYQSAGKFCSDVRRLANVNEFNDGYWPRLFAGYPSHTK
jgi:Peptidase family S41